MCEKIIYKSNNSFLNPPVNSFLNILNNSFFNLSEYDFMNDSLSLFKEEYDSSNLDSILKSMKYNGVKDIWKNLEIWDYIKIFAYAVVIVGGLLGNISITLTVALNRSMRTTINLYIANLAVADAMICIVCMLPHALSVATPKVYILGNFMCKFNTFTEMICLICSVLTLTAISCDRFFAIMFPIRAKTTKQRPSMLMIIIWIIAIVVSVPLLITRQLVTREWQDFTETQCGEKWPIHWYIEEKSAKCVSRQTLRLAYYVVVLTTLYFLPVIIMISAYFSILWKVQFNDIIGERNETNINAHSRTRRKVNKMISFVLVAFITCWTPIQVIAIYSLFPFDSESTVLPEWFSEIQWAAHFLAYANSLINPIIYGGFNETFREGFFKVLRCGYTRGQFGIPGLSGLTFTTRFSWSRSGRSNKTSQKSNVDMKLIQIFGNEDICPAARDTPDRIEETKE